MGKGDRRVEGPGGSTARWVEGQVGGRPGGSRGQVGRGVRWVAGSISIIVIIIFGSANRRCISSNFCITVSFVD